MNEYPWIYMSLCFWRSCGTTFYIYGLFFVLFSISSMYVCIAFVSSIYLYIYSSHLQYVCSSSMYSTIYSRGKTPKQMYSTRHTKLYMGSVVQKLYVQYSSTCMYMRGGTGHEHKSQSNGPEKRQKTDKTFIHGCDG